VSGNDPKVRLRLGRGIVQASVRAARRARPAETGGILLGYRDAAGIVVTDAVEIADASASPAAYRRRRRLAQQALDTALERERDALVGYVGEWHSHVARQTASRRDFQELADLARLAGDSVALLVIVVDASQHQFEAHIATPAGVGPYPVVDMIDVLDARLEILGRRQHA
jgi:integrative and conjugative element protein (TIGR02256 family)